MEFEQLYQHFLYHSLFHGQQQKCEQYVYNQPEKVESHVVVKMMDSESSQTATSQQ